MYLRSITRFLVSSLLTLSFFCSGSNQINTLRVSATTHLLNHQPVSTASVGLTTQAEIQRPAKSDEPSIPGLDWQLEQLYRASLSQDKATLDTLRGLPSVNLDSATARVIIELDTPSGAKAVGETWTEVVKTANGSLAEIHHAAPIRINADLEAALKAAGAQFETATMYQLQVVVPFNSLETLTHISGVRYVRLPFPVQPPVNTTAITNTQVKDFNYYFYAGYDGRGINIGVFDLGFTGWQARQSNGDLPAGDHLVLMDYSSIYNFTPDTPNLEHGTAVAEVVYDSAPGSTIYLYAFNTEVEFANAVSDYMDVEGKRIASLSVGWVNAGPYDGTGQIGNIITTAKNDGIFWVSAAGDQRYRHWSGVATPYGNSNAVNFSEDYINRFGIDNNNLWAIPAGFQISLYLEWNDWNDNRTGNQNHIDYDIELYKWNGTSWSFVQRSNGNQCTTSSYPTEMLNYTVPSGQSGNYGFAVQRVTSRSGTNCPNNFGHWLNLHTFSSFSSDGENPSPSFSVRNPCNSIIIPADSNNSLTVGTIPNYYWESTGSYGPANGNGGTHPSTANVKPDVIGREGVTTATYGSGDYGAKVFPGSAAAAGSVAGMAAVIWQDSPQYTLKQLHNYMTGNAYIVTDDNDNMCGGVIYGPNNIKGWGRAREFNTMPRLDKSKTVSLPAVDEDDVTNGALVSTIIDSADVDWITDSDAEALEGIALLGANKDLGTWQYSIDGTTWIDFLRLEYQTPLTLASDATTRIRFVPNPNWNGIASITIRGWDQTCSAPGEVIEFLLCGGDSNLSGDFGIANITVNPVNDAPVITLSTPRFPTITEDAVANAGIMVSTLIDQRIYDIDDGSLQGIAIFTQNPGNGTWQYSRDFGSNWVDFESVSSSSALLLRPNNKVRFLPDAMNGTNATFSYYAWDQTSGTAGSKVNVDARGGSTAFSTSADTASINVIPLIDGPALVPNGPWLVKPGNTITFSIPTQNVDLPTRPLTYTMEAGAPATATLDSASGVFEWTPGESDPLGIYTINIHVKDNNHPDLEDYGTIQILVTDIIYDLFLPIMFH